MKGIVLAGGSGTRLYPLTHSMSKQLLPVYNKPMIYYPLSVLMMCGIRDILIISTAGDKPRFEHLLGNGKQLGISLSYIIQPEPGGLAQAFILGEDFIAGDHVAMILGDNIFYGQGFAPMLERAKNRSTGATIFAYRVKHPENFGVVELDNDMQAVSIEEKPLAPRSNLAVTGLYFYDEHAVDYAKSLKPSNRGELEISDLNRIYLEKQQIQVEILGRGFAWLDTGTFDSLMKASQFIETIENRQGFKIACLEEIAFNMGYIDYNQLVDLAEPLKKNEYGQYLLDIARANKP